MQGNYVISVVKPTVISALGAIPKPNSTEVRPIDNRIPNSMGMQSTITYICDLLNSNL